MNLPIITKLVPFSQPFDNKFQGQWRTQGFGGGGGTGPRPLQVSSDIKGFKSFWIIHAWTGFQQRVIEGSTANARGQCKLRSEDLW